MADDIKKIVLAYSGGLDTSVIMTWLKEHYPESEIIAVSGDVGQGDELEGLEEKALKTGASKLYIEDLKEEFVTDYIYPTLKAGAKYEGEYLLGTSFARPIIAKRLVEIAMAEGADAICHGCTGKGNDQVRFDLTIRAFAPDMKIIAPWRVWDIRSRDDAIDYAEKHQIPLKISRETNYSKDKNIWHLSHEGMDLESTENEPDYNKPGFLEMCVTRTGTRRALLRHHFLPTRYPRCRRWRKAPSCSISSTLKCHRRQKRDRPFGHRRKSFSRHEKPRRLRDPRRDPPLQSTRNIGKHHAGQRNTAIQTADRPTLRAARLQRTVVHAASGSTRRLCRRDPTNGHRRSHIKTLQRQHNQRRCLIPLLALRPRACHLQRRYRVQPKRRHRFHLALRTAPRSARPHVGQNTKNHKG